MLRNLSFASKIWLFLRRLSICFEKEKSIRTYGVSQKAMHLLREYDFYLKILLASKTCFGVWKCEQYEGSYLLIENIIRSSNIQLILRKLITKLYNTKESVWRKVADKFRDNKKHHHMVAWDELLWYCSPASVPEREAGLQTHQTNKRWTWIPNHGSYWNKTCPAEDILIYVVSIWNTILQVF